MFTTHTISQMAYLDPVVFIQQQVFRLDVSVDDVLRVYCSGSVMCSVCSVCVHLCSVCVVYVCVCVCVSVKFRLQVRPHVHTET